MHDVAEQVGRVLAGGDDQDEAARCVPGSVPRGDPSVSRTADSVNGRVRPAVRTTCMPLSADESQSAAPTKTKDVSGCWGLTILQASNSRNRFLRAARLPTYST